MAVSQYVLGNETIRTLWPDEYGIDDILNPLPTIYVLRPSLFEVGDRSFVQFLEKTSPDIVFDVRTDPQADIGHDPKVTVEDICNSLDIRLYTVSSDGDVLSRLKGMDVGLHDLSTRAQLAIVLVNASVDNHDILKFFRFSLNRLMKAVIF